MSQTTSIGHPRSGVAASLPRKLAIAVVAIAVAVAAAIAISIGRGESTGSLTGNVLSRSGSFLDANTVNMPASPNLGTRQGEFDWFRYWNTNLD
ncbi:MAG TPA: hypothetical protein VF246_09540 [Acidimicrobiia bacterium]